MTFIISFIISFALFVYALYRMHKQPIMIKHKLNPANWIMVHAVVCSMTILLMMIVDLFHLKVSLITEYPWGVQGVVILFIQNGGLIILVMLLSSMMYNYWVKQIEFHYFVERHVWLRKLFFTLICVLMVIFYMTTDYGEERGVNILASENRMMMGWLIVLIQIWIGFGMKTSFQTMSLERLRFEQDKKALKEERQYIWACVISMFGIFGVAVIIGCISERIPKDVYEMINVIMCGISVAMVMMLLVFYGYVRMCQPNEDRSIRIIRKLMDKSKTRAQAGYFMKVKYSIRENDGKYELKLFASDVKFDDEHEFPESYVEDIKKTFAEKEECLTKEEIVDWLLDVARRRKDLVRKGFDAVYRACEEKEKAKM